MWQRMWQKHRKEWLDCPQLGKPKLWDIANLSNNKSPKGQEKA